MFNSTPMLRKDNPPWLIVNAPETIKVPGPGVSAPYGPGQRRRPLAGAASGIAAAGDAIAGVAGIVAAWLAGLPRRAGRRLFAMNDLEARWRGWQVTELSGGLRRQYRDPRFDALGQAGRLGDDTPLPPRPAVPEAWDDHWDGRGLGCGKDDRPSCPWDGDV